MMASNKSQKIIQVIVLSDKNPKTLSYLYMIAAECDARNFKNPKSRKLENKYKFFFYFLGEESANIFIQILENSKHDIKVV